MANDKTSTDTYNAIMALQQELREHVADEMSPHHQSSHDYLNILMKREARKEKLYESIIEKSLAAFVWTVICGVAYACWDYIQRHI